MLGRGTRFRAPAPLVLSGAALHRLCLPEPQALALFGSLTTVYELLLRDRHFFSLVLSNRLNQAIDRLVSSSSMRYRTSTDDLSTW